MQPPVSAPPSQRVERTRVWRWLVLLATAVAVVVAAFALVALVGGTILGIAGAAGGTASWAGILLAATGLLLGNLFLLYSLKYYVSTFSALLDIALLPANGNGRNGNGLVRFARRNGSDANGAGGNGPLYLEREPFVSIHIATFNEQRVLQRLLEACSSLDYHNFEIVLVDDSTDDSRSILDAWEGHPNLTIVRRPSRDGFKGGALAEALRHTDPGAEFVVVYDADSVPFPDSIQRFLPHFYDLNGRQGSAEPPPRPDVAAVQSYQWHVLNKSESWLTEAIRAEYAGSYMVERTFQESVGAMKMIAGTSYMIRADVLRHIGWGTSLTEDWQLTLRLYTDGYKVVYTPYAETPAECVATFSRLSRQRMRWAEGHTHQVRRGFGPVMRSPLLSPFEKLEFLYYSTYYLQAVFFVAGTLSWLVAEIGLHTHLPGWTSVFGWSLLITNLLSLPFMNMVGLLMEEAPARDLVGVLGAIATSFLLVPFQAWAAFKGLFERDEGPWFRTPKTGRVTESVSHLHRVRRWLSHPRLRGGSPRSGGPPVRTITARRRRGARRTGWIASASIGLVLAGVVAGAIRAPEASAQTNTNFYQRRPPTAEGGNGQTNALDIRTGTALVLENFDTIDHSGAFDFMWPARADAATVAPQTIFATTQFRWHYWARDCLASNTCGFGVNAGTSTSIKVDVRFAYAAGSGWVPGSPFRGTSECVAPITDIATLPGLTISVPSGGAVTEAITAPFSPPSDVSVPSGVFFCLLFNLPSSTHSRFQLRFAWPDTAVDSSRIETTQEINLPEHLLPLAWLALIVPLFVRVAWWRRHTPPRAYR